MAVACGLGLTTVVIEKGDLWSFSNCASGQLGLSTKATQLLLAWVGGADVVFDGEAVVMVAVGYEHTACVMVRGTLWTWGCSWGGFGQLGHGDTAEKLMLMLVWAEGFRGAQIVMVATGHSWIS